MVLVERSGLVTVTGGKWTTYPAMAEDVLRHCRAGGLMPSRPAGVTASLGLVGAPASAAHRLSDAPGTHLYGTESAQVDALPGAERELAPG